MIELIGGTGAARGVVLDALAAGKSVVTANKALMATHGEEVMDAAEAADVDILFEASVGGGIPIIGPLKHALTSNEIESVMGIVNGTTNYMLTRMADEGIGYDDALAEAQRRGFAEADPTADVDGLDAAAKIAILACDRVQQPGRVRPGAARGHPRAHGRGHRVRRRDGLRDQAHGDRAAHARRASTSGCTRR